jgi:3-phosphoshikimate 1-carboxyvinyltransferase
MNNVIINSSNLKGHIRVPSSKSVCHRAVICAGLSEGVSNIENVFFSQDIKATCGAMSSLGVNLEIDMDDSKIKVNGKKEYKSAKVNIDCFESGSTLRFLIPVASALGKEATFKGQGKLVERPLEDYYRIFDSQGVDYKNDSGNLPLTIKGRLKPGEYRIRGDISSQFITGLLFALPLLEEDSKIIVTTELESKPYVDLTIDCLGKFSVQVQNDNYTEFSIKGKQKYGAVNYDVEGDFSQAAFWLVAGTLGADVTCSGMNIDSLQGDKAIIGIIEAMGGRISIEKDKIKAIPSKTKATVIDAKQCPDLVPVLAVLAALSEGTTEIINAARLRFKESDRLRAITSELSKIGADIEERPEGLIIRGRESFIGGTVDSWNDHRIAMAMAVASLKCREPLIIKDAQSVKKSYPNFWEHFDKLGGNIHEWKLGK